MTALLDLGERIHKALKFIRSIILLELIFSRQRIGLKGDKAGVSVWGA